MRKKIWTQRKVARISERNQASSPKEKGGKPQTLRHRSAFRHVRGHSHTNTTNSTRHGKVAMARPHSTTSRNNWTPHYVSNYQPFCCLKDWMEPEWCTIATFTCLPPALIQFRKTKSQNTWGTMLGLRRCFRSSHPAKRDHWRWCANPSNTCLSFSHPASSAVYGCCHGDGATGEVLGWTCPAPSWFYWLQISCGKLARHK